MELTEHQIYNAWYKALGNKLMDWHEAKPDNKDLINLLKAVELIGTHNNKLNKENRELELELKTIKQTLKGLL
jgi:hypothetical protein